MRFSDLLGSMEGGECDKMRKNPSVECEERERDDEKRDKIERKIQFSALVKAPR